MTRYFHLLSDDKTVKEIDFKTYQKYAWYEGYYARKVCAVGRTWITFSQSRHKFVYVNLRQLKKILEKLERET